MRYNLSLLSLATAGSVFAGPITPPFISTTHHGAGSSGHISGADIMDFGSGNITTNIKTTSNVALGGIHGDDLNRLRSLGLKEGVNPFFNNEKIWVGNDGYMKLTFTNWNTARLILCIWHASDGYLNAHQPELTISLEPFKQVTISVADKVLHNAFSAIYPDTKVAGQIYNTWGEFSVSGHSSTINVSREPWMRGHSMDIRSRQTGCRTSMESCVFVCKKGDRCGKAQEYDLINCDPTKGGSFQMVDYHDGGGLVPSGGCMMGAGGQIDVALN